MVESSCLCFSTACSKVNGGVSSCEAVSGVVGVAIVREDAIAQRFPAAPLIPTQTQIVYFDRCSVPFLQSNLLALLLLFMISSLSKYMVIYPLASF